MLNKQGVCFLIRPEYRTELHCHSYYSLLDGLPSPTEIANNAVEKGMKSIALTDHGVVGGMAEFFLEAKKQSIKPIYGIEMYETDETSNKDKDNINRRCKYGSYSRSRYSK